MRATVEAEKIAAVSEIVVKQSVFAHSCVFPKTTGFKNSCRNGDKREGATIYVEMHVNFYKVFDLYAIGRIS